MEIQTAASPQHFSAQHTDTSSLTGLVDRMQDQISTVLVGQTQMLEMLMAGLLADGHILIEGVPGVAKTLTAKLLARLIGAGFSRIQFTPDLMPSDVIGTNIFNPQAAQFEFKPGPIFSNLVLIDEINRAPAKTQSALFEVMEERQVTVDGRTYPMAPPFMVVATQNPIEHEGTYRLPEAQLDRFLMKIVIGYPDLADEVKILERHQTMPSMQALAGLQPVVSSADLQDARGKLRGVHVEPKTLEFIARIVTETRGDRSIHIGGSPRASIALLQVSKALAVLAGRDFVIPDDVLKAVPPVLRHRITLTPEREMEGGTEDGVLKELVGRLEVPR
jgi:MoxR-like ATPase